MTLSSLEGVGMGLRRPITSRAIMASGALPAEELGQHPRLQLAATLVKPFTCDELLGTVNKVLRATASTRE